MLDIQGYLKVENNLKKTKGIQIPSMILNVTFSEHYINLDSSDLDDYIKGDWQD